MSKTLKRILIIVSIVLASLSLIVFAVYKIFVTPEIKVQLSLVNAFNDINDSFDFYADDDEEDLLKYVSKNGGKSIYNLNISKSPLFEGASATLTTTGTGNSSVTELDFNKYLKLDIYTTKDEMLINTPLFNGGLKIPFTASESDWENSLFKDAYNALPHSEKPLILMYFSNNGIEASDFIKSNKSELISWVRSINVKKEKSDTVNIGDKEQKAEVFALDITENDTKKLSDIMLGYLNTKGINQVGDIETALSDFIKNNTIVFKIKNFNIYEINIGNKNGDTHIVEFSGKGNQFDIVSYYKNSDKKSAISRIRTKNSSKTVDIMKKGDAEILRFERTKNRSKFKFENDSKEIEITASGMEVDEGELSYDDLEIKIGDNFVISGRYSLARKSKADKLEFNKSGEYIDVTKLPGADWDAISSVLSSAVNLIPEI